MKSEFKSKKLSNLKQKINKGDFPSQFPHFGGANLIITDNPNYLGYPHDTRIVTIHASALSWLVVELKEIYDEDLDWINKYDFYPIIGKFVNEGMKTTKNLTDLMLLVVARIEKEWA